MLRRGLLRVAESLPARCQLDSFSSSLLPTPAWCPNLARGASSASGTHRSLHPPPRSSAPPLPSFLQAERPPGWASAGGGLSPFTPTRLLVKRKSLFKRAAFIMQTLEHEAAAAASTARPVPPFRPGDVLDVHMTVPENKARPTSFRGLVIARRNRGIGSSFLLRTVLNNFVVERAFPLYSPNVLAVKVVERRSAARNKLYFVRSKPLKQSRVAGADSARGQNQPEKTAGGGGKVA